MKFLKPEFFDIFGIGAFGFITVLSIWAIKTRGIFPQWTAIVLLTIGIVGLIVDATIVYTKYLRQKSK